MPNQSLYKKAIPSASKRIRVPRAASFQKETIKEKRLCYYNLMAGEEKSPGYNGFIRHYLPRLLPKFHLNVGYRTRT